MGYYDQEENVREYIKMSKGYSSEPLIEIIKEYLPMDSSLLELGMGEGKDLLLLAKHYKVTGSDSSQAFLALFNEKHPELPTCQLDARKLLTNDTFDSIYSNKVLYHLSKKELKESLNRQTSVLNKGGIVAHTFWVGNGAEDYLDLHFAYYSVKEIRDIFSLKFDVLYLETYSEEKKDDSILVIAKKSENPI